MQHETMMTKRTVFAVIGLLVGGLLMASLVPAASEAAMNVEQLKGMVEKSDHAGLAESYKKLAEEARTNAAAMKTMASEYLKKFPKNTYAKHCEKMEDMFLQEAKHYEDLAEMHSKAAKPAGK